MEIKKTWQIEQEHLNEKGQVWEKSDHKKWVAVDDINNLKDEIRTCLNFQFERMDDLRLMHSQIKGIQDKHWSYLYLGNLTRIGQELDKLEKHLNSQSNEKTEEKK